MPDGAGRDVGRILLPAQDALVSAEYVTGDSSKRPRGEKCQFGVHVPAARADRQRNRDRRAVLFHVKRKPCEASVDRRGVFHVKPCRL
ncbi:MAG: hypothetical protein D6741_19820 [Planctomycetota bacterium]|nr:MAG: hypothetical protein D6741_19820 [Planctomycetota bacterium]